MFSCNYYSLVLTWNAGQARLTMIGNKLSSEAIFKIGNWLMCYVCHSIGYFLLNDAFVTTVVPLPRRESHARAVPPNTESFFFFVPPSNPPSIVTTTLTNPASATQLLHLCLHLFTTWNLQTYSFCYLCNYEGCGLLLSSSWRLFHSRSQSQLPLLWQLPQHVSLQIIL